MTAEEPGGLCNFALGAASPRAGARVPALSVAALAEGRGCECGAVVAGFFFFLTISTQDSSNGPREILTISLSQTTPELMGASLTAPPARGWHNTASVPSAVWPVVAPASAAVGAAAVVAAVVAAAAVVATAASSVAPPTDVTAAVAAITPPYRLVMEGALCRAPSVPLPTVIPSSPFPPVFSSDY